MSIECWPPENMRDVGADHYLRECNGSNCRVQFWSPIGRWFDVWGNEREPYDAGAEGFIYVAPVPSPETISILITALDRIAHMHRAEALIAIAALHKYDPSRRVLNNSSLPEIDTTIKPPAKYYPERQS